MDKRRANGIGRGGLDGERHLRACGRAQLGEAMAQRLREMRPTRTGRGRGKKNKAAASRRWGAGWMEKGERDQAGRDSAVQTADRGFALSVAG